jgi:VWFA-related protein
MRVKRLHDESSVSRKGRCRWCNSEQARRVFDRPDAVFSKRNVPGSQESGRCGRRVSEAGRTFCIDGMRAFGLNQGGATGERMRQLTLAVWVVFLAATSVPLSSQAQPPVFTAEVRYVEFPVRVLDRQGSFVRNLGPRDFEIFEDGTHQNLATLALVDTTTSVGNTMVSPSSSDQPLPAVAASHKGRVYLFILDDYHVSANLSTVVKRLVHRFLDAYMTSDDVGAVTFTSGAVRQDLTSDRRLLTTAADRFIGETTFDASRGRSEGLSVTKTLADMADWLGSMRGQRKSIVYISSQLGCDLDRIDVHQDSALAQQCRNALLDAVQAATEADVAVYSIDPQGVNGHPWGAADAASSDAPAQKAPGGVTPAERLRLSQGRGVLDGLRAVADLTGGFATINTNSFDAAFQRIVDENSTYFLVGYYSSHVRPDGRFHKNEVRVARRGVKVLYRSGYRAPRQSRTR